MDRIPEFFPTAKAAFFIYSLTYKNPGQFKFSKAGNASYDV